MVEWRKLGLRVKAFVITHYLPLAFLVALVWAMAWPAPGKAVVSVTILDGSVHIMQEIAMILVFFVSGLVLKTDDLKTALKYKPGCAYGFISILFITPCLGFALRAIPLVPSEFAAGLTLYAVVPTTLGVGISLVRSCKGNEGLALLLTVGTNMLGIVTMPIWLKALFTDSSLDLHVDILNLFVKLLITIFVPSVIGKAVREIFSPSVPRFTTWYKTPLSIFSTTMLAFIVWQTLSAAQSTLIQQQFVQILYVILLAIAQHILYLLFNFAVIHLMRMPLPEAVATGIMSSQKSAPVAVTVISYLTTDVAQQGLLAIPAIVGQLTQIFLGSALAPFFAWRIRKWRMVQAAAAGPSAADVAAAAAAALEEGSAGGGGKGQEGSAGGGDEPGAEVQQPGSKAAALKADYADSLAGSDREVEEQQQQPEALGLEAATSGGPQRIH